MTSTEKRKPGRPVSLAPGQRKTNNLTFRARPAMRAKLVEAAEASGRSVSEEIEHRLDQSFDAERIRRAAFGHPATEIAAYLWGSTVKLLEFTSGRPWTSDRGVRAAAAAALTSLLEELATSVDSAGKSETDNQRAGFFDREFDPEIGKRLALSMAKFAGHDRAEEFVQETREKRQQLMADEVGRSLASAWPREGQAGTQDTLASPTAEAPLGTPEDRLDNYSPRAGALGEMQATVLVPQAIKYLEFRARQQGLKHTEADLRIMTVAQIFDLEDEVKALEDGKTSKPKIASKARRRDREAS